MTKHKRIVEELWARDEIASPCVNICVVHPRAHVCAGCLRTLDEIAAWSTYAPEERARIMEELPNRRSHLRKRRGGRKGRLGEAD